MGEDRMVNAMDREIPSIRLEDITAATDELIRASRKFEVFFSRAELDRRAHTPRRQG